MRDPTRFPAHRRMWARLRSLWRGVVHRSRFEEEMREEFRAHIEMRADDLVRQGLSRAEATRRAHVEFGHVDTHRDRARAARGLRWIDQVRFSWIDLRLGVRMMLKYPGLTAVAVLALALGVPTGLAPSHLARALDRPLPEDTENRVRAIRFWNPATGVMRLPTSGDLTLLSERLGSFDLLGAYRNGSYNIGSAGGGLTAVSGAEVTASALSMLEVTPAMGRLLDRADEAVGSADVAVIGHRLWRTRFAADPEIVGRSVQIGSRPHTVVGVMPDGFRYPLSDELWLPLRREATAAPGEGRTLRIVGRLTPDASDEEAQAEVAALTLPATHPAVTGTVRQELEVVPFSYTYIGLPRGGFGALPEFHFMRLLGSVLLLVACANVAMLIFARTATRFRELAVRTALGAGRWRIVSQVFAETLVLALCASGIGLLVVDQVMRRIPWERIAGESALPYWLDLGVPAGVIPMAALLTVLSATVAAVAPALSVTRGDIHRSIRSADAGRSGIRFGGVTGTLIVADVALAVGVIGFAVGVTEYLNDLASSDARAGIPAEEYLAVELRLSENDLTGSPADGTRTERWAQIQEQLASRLAAEPGVRAVTFGDALPRMNHRSRLVHVDGGEVGGDSGRWARVARVDAGFFQQLEQPILAGRGFVRADTEVHPAPVIVNSMFSDRVLGGGSAIGRHVRFSTEDDAPWHEIVGVVGRLGMNTVSRDGSPGVYLVEPPGAVHPLQVGVRIGPEPMRFVPRLREVVAETDPTVMVGTPAVLGRVQQGDWFVAIGIVVGMALLVAILVVLAASGLYAIMSFSVSERTREIGIRSALGAGRRTLVVTILRRALAQLGIGALLGIPLGTWFLLQIQDPDAATPALTAIARSIPLGLLTVSIVALASCVAPARRALAIEANDALRAD